MSEMNIQRDSLVFGEPSLQHTHRNLRTMEMLELPEKTVKINETVKIEECERCDINLVKNIRKSAILRNEDVYAYYKNIFDSCDTNKDGLVNTSELKQFIANQEEDEIPEDVIKNLHSCFDQDKDDQLDFNEFLDMINHPSVVQTFKRIGSRYLKFVTVSSIRKKSLKLRRTITNTGLYEEEIVFRKYNVGMILLSAIQILFFYMDYYINYYINEECKECKECNKNRKPIVQGLQFDYRRRSEVWRYVTYILVHSRPSHLFGNVFIQLLIGVPLEMVHGWRVLVIYVVGAFGGCLAHSVFSRNIGLNGGSGGVYAFFTAHIATVIMNWREMSHPIVHLIFFGIITVFDVIYNYYMVLIKNSTQGVETSYIDHLVGAIVGLLLGLTILRNLRVTKTEKIVWYISIIGMFVLFIIFITADVTLTLTQKNTNSTVVHNKKSR